VIFSFLSPVLLKNCKIKLHAYYIKWVFQKSELSKNPSLNLATAQYPSKKSGLKKKLDTVLYSVWRTKKEGFLAYRPVFIGGKLFLKS